MYKVNTTKLVAALKALNAKSLVCKIYYTNVDGTSTLIPSCSVERCNKVPRVRCFKCHYYLIRVLGCVLDSFTLRNLCLTSVGVGAFVIGLSQISSFFSNYQHLFPAAVLSVVTRFPASGCF